MARTLTLTCLQAGGARIVDGGRPGYGHLGVAAGGPADFRAMSAANHLLSRPDDATCLEFSGAGGRWLLSGEGQFCLTGADMNWRLNGRLVEACQVQYLDGDGLLIGSLARRGLRAYLAANGDWDLPVVLDSREPGVPGTRAITDGWSVAVNWEEECPFRSDFDVHRFHPSEEPAISVVPGPEWSLLSPEQQRWLTTTAFTVSADSNRQGIRLTGEDLPGPAIPNQLSSPVLPGTVQLTPTGPILLGPDAQTIGGYPRVLLVTEPAERAVAFQVKTGDDLRFRL